MPEDSTNNADQQPAPDQPDDQLETPQDGSTDEIEAAMKEAEDALAEDTAAPGSEETGGTINQDEIEAALAAAAGQTDAGDAEETGGTINQDEIEAALAAAAGQTDVGDAEETDGAINQDEIEAAMAAMAAQPEQPVENAGTEANGSTINQDEVEAAMEAMLAGAEQVAASPPAEDVEAAMAAMLEEAEQTQPVAQEPVPPPPDTSPFEPQLFSNTGLADDGSQIDLLDDVELDVKIELGRTEMYIEDVLGLGSGSVVELDKAAGDPVDIFVNEKLVARGEVLVLNDSFCVRINDIVSPVPELGRQK